MILKSLHNISYQNQTMHPNPMRNSLKLIVFLASTFILTACSSVNSRISENQHQFNTFAPEAQAQIQSGHIDVGFTEDMVYMALGRPSDKETLARDGKTLLIWKYLRRSFKDSDRYASAGLSSPYAYPTIGPGPVQTLPPIQTRQYDKVEFIDGKVVRWDQSLQFDPPEAGL